jgi:Fe-S-cluster formation regulator IscX/YfhJ
MKKTLTAHQVDVIYAGLDAWIDIMNDNFHDSDPSEVNFEEMKKDIATAEELRENFYDYFVKAEES